MCNFGHLHAHSEYSTLDGMGRLREMFQVAKSHGQTFLAITDHGTMSGLWEAQKIAEEEGMKAILGCEFYYEREGDGENGHLLVLAKNNTGLLNMMKLQAWASKFNFKRKPRITFEKLKDHSEGLIVTSACLGSAFNQYILNGQIQEATEWARKYKATFGEDFYIEIQPNEIPEQHLVNTTSIRIAKQLNIQLVATNDVHYVLDSDCYPHEVLLAMQTHKKMDNEKRFKFSTNDFWLKSEAEMFDTFKGLDETAVSEAIHNTSIIAEKCTAKLVKGSYLPRFYDIPPNKLPREVLAEKIMRGLKNRGFARDRPFVEQVQHELDVIDRNGYSDYFLIVQDFVTSAKQRGELVGDGRGSGAGSKVAYVTGITEIPPHEYDLLFERFMADGREPDSLESSDMETYRVKFGEPRLQVGVRLKAC